MKPKFNSTATCPNCGSPAVQMALDSPNFEAVTWCESGCVAVSKVNERTKKVYDFHAEEY
jgi:hypothetical protein